MLVIEPDWKSLESNINVFGYSKPLGKEMKVSDNWEIAKEELSNSDSIMMKIIELYDGEKMQLKNNIYF